MIAPPPVICSRMRVAPPQKRAPQLLHWTDGDVACSVSTVTVAQTLPSRLAIAFGAVRTRAGPPAGFAVLLSPRRDCMMRMFVCWHGLVVDSE